MYRSPSIQPTNSLRVFSAYSHKRHVKFKRDLRYINLKIYNYRKVSNIRRTFVGDEIVDYSDVVGASPVGAAPTTL